MIERLAEWYLRRQGRVVLSRTFVGIAFGYCIASKTGGDNMYDHWSVIVPKIGKLIALNNSMVNKLGREA